MQLRGMHCGSKSVLTWALLLLFFLSANGQSLAFLLCNDANCPMFAKAKVAQKSCCESKKEAGKKSCACCELSALPHMDQGPTKISFDIPHFEVTALMAEPVDVRQVHKLISVEQILFRSDHSPPEPTFAPDMGRAPPAS